MSASSREPNRSSSAVCWFGERSSFMGFWRWRGAKRTNKVSGWARRSTSRAVHWAKLVLKICVPEPSVNTLI